MINTEIIREGNGHEAPASLRLEAVVEYRVSD